MVDEIAAAVDEVLGDKIDDLDFAPLVDALVARLCG